MTVFWAGCALGFLVAVTLFRYRIEIRTSKPERDLRELEAALKRHRRESREWQAAFRGMRSAIEDMLAAKDRDDPNIGTLLDLFHARVEARIKEYGLEIDQ